MASEHDRAESVRPEALPSHPSLEMQQKRAKNLLRAASQSDADAWRRIRALHPKPPAADALKLADTQLVVARGYGFESWAAMRRKILSLTKTPVEQFHAALRAGDAEHVRALLTAHADVRAAVNQPVPNSFGSRPARIAKKHLDVIDVLIEYGADLNLKSDWKPGPFGLLEYGITPEEAAPLIARGAIVDIFAAAHLGMFDRVRELVDADPSLVHARGGDGKTALHCARDLDIARYLVDHGADIDARDVDHYSTPAQYLVRDAPAVARLLVDSGAWADIFIAVGLRDAALVERCLREDPEALDHRAGQGKYTAAVHHGTPSRGKESGGQRGDTYRWVFNHNASAMDVARMLGFDDMLALLERHASPAQRLLAACGAADRPAAEAIVADHPDVVRTLTRDQMRLIADRAHANDTAAVTLMLDVGFDPLASHGDDFEPIRWAAFHGNADMMRALLRHNPPINTPDRSYGGTLLANCLYGSIHGWHCDTGDYVGTVRLLLAAGERVDASWLPIGRDDVDAVLRDHLQASPAPPPPPPPASER
jgi:ankyrin repeat protein